MNFLSKMVILLSSFLFVLSSCGEQSSISQGSLDPNGSTISETVIGQHLVVEDILSEDKLGELEINTEKVVQEKVSEKIIVQDLKIEMMPAEDALDHYYYGDLAEDDGGASAYDINWPMVIGKFAAGSVVIIATGVAAYFTSEIPGVGYVFLCSFKGL
jgi:hypothetical protein